MMDRFLQRLYGPTRREIELQKVAGQFAKLSTADLSAMAHGGLDALSSPLPPTCLADASGPSADPAGTPLQGGPQGGGLDGQGPLGLETAGLKTAHSDIAGMIRAELTKQADWGSALRSAGGVLKHPAAIGAAGGAALGGWRGFNEDRAQGGSGISGALTGGLKGGAIGGAVGGAAGLLHSGAKVLAPGAKGVVDTFQTALEQVRKNPFKAGGRLMEAAQGTNTGKMIGGALSKLVVSE